MIYTIKPKKYLGQHFLQDEKIIKKIIQLSKIQKQDEVLEIGAGTGALTKHLVSNNNNINIVEIDSNIIPALINNCKKYGKINKIYNTDFLKFSTQEFNQKKIKVIGNLPYNISSKILFKIIQMSDKIKDAHFMLQKDFVERIVSPPNNKCYGRLSVILQYHFKCNMMLKIFPESFYPRPKVESAILQLKPKKTKLLLKNYNFFEKIVKQSFFQRRKTLYNNLKKYTKK